MLMTSSCSSRQSSPPGNPLIIDLAWVMASLRSLVCVMIDTQHDAVLDTISGERTACNNACLACGVNSPPVLLTSSTVTSF